MTAQLELPSGPAAHVPPAQASQHGAYRAWLKTPDGARAWEWIRDAALAEAKAGVKRVSVNRLVELVRATKKIEVNNTYRAWLADDLIVLYPELRDVIERRQRRARAT